MLLKVGLHRGGVQVCARRADFHEFEERGISVGGGKSVSVQVLKSHIELMPSSVGPHFNPADGKQVGDDWHYVLHDVQRVPVRSHNFVTRGEWFGVKLVVDTLLPHLLPWPKEYDVKSKNGDSRERIISDLRVRLDSAEEHTGYRRIPVPGNIVELLTVDEQLRLFQEWRI